MTDVLMTEDDWCALMRARLDALWIARDAEEEALRQKVIRPTILLDVPFDIGVDHFAELTRWIHGEVYRAYGMQPPRNFVVGVSASPDEHAGAIGLVKNRDGTMTVLDYWKR